MVFMPESTPGTSQYRAHQIITGKRMDHPRPCSSHCSEEEEDMANCLIMLAHSVSPAKQEKTDENCNNPDKLRVPSLSEIASGSYNYECKTCNRVFPSFQALGGHTASHKKPKVAVEDQNSVPIKTEFSLEVQPKVLVEEHEIKKVTITKRSHSPPPGFIIQTGYKNGKTKVHECSICGSEFLSGQALGGHMRRHRTVPPSSNQIAVPLNNMSVNHITRKSPVLTFDLNLPAPEVVHDVHSSFQFTAGSSQQPLVFSVTALVDCHY